MKLMKVDIFLMYITQGLPFGFQTDICPYLLKSWGYSYKSLGIVNLTFWPWVLKPFLAPFLENSGDFALLLSLLVLVAVHVGTFVAIFREDVPALAFVLLASNASAASFDIIVDKRAIQSRVAETEEETDLTNSMQVVGYKLGSMLSGSLTMALAACWAVRPAEGLSASPLLSAGITLALAARLYRGAGAGDAKPQPYIAESGQSALAAFRSILRDARTNTALYILLLVYKLGETVGDRLLKLFLQEQGMHLSGLAALNSWNDVVSILGSCATVFFPRSEHSDKRNLLIALCANILPQILRYLVVTNEQFRGMYPLLLISAIEHFIGGSVTVALFNFMFASVAQGIEGTHYSVLASLEVCGKLWAGSLALFLVPSLGFEALFFAAIVLSVCPVVLLGVFIPNTKSHGGKLRDKDK